MKTLTAQEPSAARPDAETADLGAVHEQIYVKLRDLLVSGQLSPGQTVSVRTIARDFGVSAMPAREALRRLASAGAVVISGNRRATIAHIRGDELDQIRAARLALEPEIARRALRRVSHVPKLKRQLLDALARHDALLDGAIADGDVGRYARHNSDFHFEIYRAADSGVIFGLIEALWLQFGPTMRTILGRLGTSNFGDDLHKVAIAALRSGDEEAFAGAIRDDIAHGLDSVVEGPPPGKP